MTVAISQRKQRLVHVSKVPSELGDKIKVYENTAIP